MLKCDGIVWLKGSGSSQYACWTQPRLSIGYLLQEWKNVQKFSGSGGYLQATAMERAMPSSTLNAESSSGEKLAPKRPVMTAAVVAIGTSPTNKSPHNGLYKVIC